MARTQAADYDKKREAITIAAAELFGEKGFASASISELAAACGFSKSLIYHYYQSKEDILFEVMDDHINGLLNVIRTHDAAVKNPADSLQTLSRELLRHYVGSENAQKVLLYELDALPENRRKEIVAKQRDIVTAVREIIAAASPTLSNDTARLRAKVMLYFGMLNWTHNWFKPSGGLSRDDLADLAAETILASN
ncbi:MAG: TetR/AcrR family transcriptional regulator [Marinicaulis sp.]|nr:TetR/AcrR family transcriptional regulator [Marinicaulis sp.]